MSILLGFLVGVICYAVASALGGLSIVAAWTLLRRKLQAVEPRLRGELLLTMRLFPAVLGALVTLGLYGRAYWLFEPSNAGEVAGPGLVLLALGAAVLVLRGPTSALLALRSTSSLVREWMVDAETPTLTTTSRAPVYVVNTVFPVVTVVGLARPRILMARSVRRACSDREVAAVLAHERAHIEAGDNWKRLLMTAAPDALAWTSAHVAIQRDWGEASEQVADEGAREPLSLALAAALVKVSRLAVTSNGCPATLVAFYRSGAITRRIERLLQRRKRPPHARSDVWPLALLLAVSLVVLVPPVALLKVHAVTEVFVALLQ